MQKIAFVVMPGFQVMSLTGMSVFEFANIAARLMTWKPGMMTKATFFIASPRRPRRTWMS